MATKIRRNTIEKKISRFKRKARISARISGAGDRPRLAVFRSNKYLYSQLIDDKSGATLAAAWSGEDSVKGKSGIEAAKAVGALIAERAIAKSVNKVVFDRSGYIYHGRVKAVADAAREKGLKF